MTGTRIENVVLDKSQLKATETFSVKKATLVDGNGKPIANTLVELVNNGSTTSVGFPATSTDDAQEFIHL